MLENHRISIIAHQDQQTIFLTREEIYMIRMEHSTVVLYTKEKTFTSKKRLYEIEEMLGTSFIRISKSTIVNMQHIHYVEPSFQGMMLLVMKNGCRDYISRKYLANFKAYLGL